MVWRAWMTSCLVAALAGVLAGAVYAAATGSFDLPPRAGAGALPSPSEPAGSAAPIGGLAPAVVSAAAAASHDTSTGSKADDRKAKEPKAKEGRAKGPKVKEPKAAKATRGEIKKGGGKKASGNKQKGK